MNEWHMYKKINVVHLQLYDENRSVYILHVWRHGDRRKRSRMRSKFLLNLRRWSISAWKPTETVSRRVSDIWNELIKAACRSTFNNGS